MKTISDSVRLFQVSDSHCYANDDARLTWTDMPIYPNRSLQAVLDHLQERQEGYSALLLTGDLAQEETPATYQRVNQMLNAFPLPVFTIPGNHDIPHMMQENLSGNVQMPEQVALGNWHLLLLDTHADGKPGGRLTDGQFARFEELLTQLPADCFAAVFMHHHPIPIDSAWMDVMGLREQRYFWSLLEHFPQVKVVFNGHIHQEFSGRYEYADGRKVAVYGTPATCVQMKPLRKNIEFDHNRPAWRDITLLADGSVETSVHYLPGILFTDIITASI
ncbi:metallophosphoesterase [Thiothrix nivea]|uniref:Metallophosphoesterase n=1 Tax=Thiothrix nivea (strain ATCC 35100 / DSM 5205 / JP2) TaxID=870187 RepID=A0A656HFY1_THINJ|nr:metallophosphoesterase [Thiothrix nivea]EIJ34914.1 metallophosphoesterase [Thiothrix nivea DSM 5205]